MKTTIVTAYFQLPTAKKPHTQYLQWMQNMLIIQTPMVIFSDEASKTIIEQIWGNLPTRYITLSFNDFYTARYDLKFYEHQLMDHEIGIGHNMHHVSIRMGIGFADNFDGIGVIHNHYLVIVCIFKFFGKDRILIPDNTFHSPPALWRKRFNSWCD